MLARLRPFLPWLSLCTGVAGALLMNRSPGRAFIVVVAAIVGWALLVSFTLAERAWASARTKTTAQKGARFALLLSNQIALQQALLFPLPFYVRAGHVGMSVNPLHIAFFLAYAAALAVALWDPLFQRAIKRASTSILLQAFAAFVGLNMVLPVLGLSNSVSLTIAGAATAIGVPILMLLVRSPSSTRDRVFAVVAAAAIVGVVRVAAPLVPPAPLETVSIALGTSVEERELKGAARVIELGRDGVSEIVCHSAIKAPLGLKDELAHVSIKDGRAFNRVVLDLRGGREAGFRTWSRERASPGDWRCRVETASGQVLGEAQARVEEP